MRPENCIGKPTLTVRPDWLVSGESQQWRAKTAENMGIGVGRFACFCFCGLSLAIRCKPVASDAEAVANPLQGHRAFGYVSGVPSRSIVSIPRGRPARTQRQ
jgi:hypothetical protein